MSRTATAGTVTEPTASGHPVAPGPAAGAAPTRGARWRERMWFVVPQAVGRLESVLIFAVVAHRVDAAYVGALALATAFITAAYACAPAIIGKPLIVTADPGERRRYAPEAQSGAVLLSLAAGALMLLPALVTHGPVAAALLAGAIGIPAMMLVESTYWRQVSLSPGRASALPYCAAYLVQAVVTVIAAYTLPPGPTIIASAASLALPGLVMVARAHDLTLRGARSWLTGHPHRWWPYLVGVAAAVAVVQAIPVVLSATAGLGASGTYRAGEVAFGGSNLLIGVTTQVLLTQNPARVRRAYLAVSTALVVVTAANGVAVWLLPRSVLTIFLGSTTPLLLAQLLIITVQRSAQSVCNTAGILLITRMSTRTVGLIDVASAALCFGGLTVGGLIGDLRGALVGLTAAQLAILVCGGILLARATRDEKAAQPAAGFGAEVDVATAHRASEAAA